jgi:hypothetical protein
MTSNTLPTALQLKAETHALCTYGLSRKRQLYDGSHALKAEASGKIQPSWWTFWA